MILSVAVAKSAHAMIYTSERLTRSLLCTFFFSTLSVGFAILENPFHCVTNVCQPGILISTPLLLFIPSGIHTLQLPRAEVPLLLNQVRNVNQLIPNCFVSLLRCQAFPLPCFGFICDS